MEEKIKNIIKFSQGSNFKIISRESGYLEFKENFNWLSKSKYAKSLAAFANKNGGFLVFGISNNPRELIGLNNKKFENKDESEMSEYFNSIFSPEIEFSKFIIQIKKKKIGLISVETAKKKPVTSIKNDNEIKEAEIYYRYNASSEKIKYPELKIILDEVREKEKKSWMEHLERITNIGASNAAILDMKKGDIVGGSGVIVIDEKLLPKLKFITEGTFRKKGKPVLKLIGEVKPISSLSKKETKTLDVKITDRKNAPEVRITEINILKEYTLGYYDLIRVLRNRYANFKLVSRFHEIKDRLKKSSRFCKTRVLDPRSPKSATKDFYHPRIIKEFDKFYKKKEAKEIKK